MEKGTDSASPEKGPKGKVILTEERCKGCSFCVEFCATGALALGTRLNYKGYRLPELAHPEKCNGCDLCGLYCPDFAIFGVRLGREKKGE
jgi:2-oxoglutarate ferredoxin oxidoreductase subunit delta